MKVWSLITYYQTRHTINLSMLRFIEMEVLLLVKDCCECHPNSNSNFLLNICSTIYTNFSKVTPQVHKNYFLVGMSARSPFLHIPLPSNPKQNNTITVFHSLRVAVPSPQGKTGGNERLQKAGTNRVMWRHAFAWKYIMASYWIKATSNTFENAYWLS